ncbi:senescence-associated domain-containing protein [Sporobolomyces salmoneus]|uniref:senescence-associated domain-containing protein n=1 Tax=Sporobolomyces salmoneus TaxID=183962 RepID=UPI00317A1DEB
MPQGRLLTIPRVSLSLLSSVNDSPSDPPLFTGSLSLDLLDLPPALPSRLNNNATSPPSSSASSLYDQPIPGSFQQSRSPSPRPSSPTPRKYLRLSLTLDGEDGNRDEEPIFSMPVVPDSHQVGREVSTYLLPNLTGSDPLTTFESTPGGGGSEKRQQQHNQNGWIKLELPRETGTEHREYFESILQQGAGTLSSPSSPPPSFEFLERNQLYVVDESTGRVLGQLDDEGDATTGGRISLEEDSELSNGRMHDDNTKISSSEIDTFNLDGKEAVVINSLTPSNDSSSSKPTFNASRFSVKPLSAYYSPAPNPDNSTIISVGNFISHGLVIGSSLISQGFEKGAGHYVSSRPATQSPMVFKDTTKKNWENSSRYTQKAAMYSGQASGYVGKLAGQVGDKIGKATGLQSKPGNGGQTPTGLKGLVVKSLIALNTVGDHLDASGKTLIESGSKSASQVVHHKWGGEARGISDDVGSSVKHCALVYIDARGVTRRALIKAVGKGALKAKMADGSQLYLTDSSASSEYELQQIEQAAKTTGSGPTPSSSVTNSTTKTNSTNPFDDRAGGAGGRGGGGAISSPPSYSSSSGTTYGDRKNQ